ncbi:phage neck terminator protein [Rodentibacter ratti]|uniref:Phage neck terminator protein gp12-like domain-containing protein n=1 Tax=Rodentibacter ratti TaxID=1906745 RepID=A0A1V3L6Q5_9PAST|nr:hypothetical protein [Rodentibacter ratti]OOF85133.1 hypothetical protein BKG88_09230 [Rodentibacter ratti]
MLDTLYDLLSPLSEYPFIRAYENGRQPSLPFFTFDVRFEKTPNHYLQSAVDNEGNQRTKTHIDGVLEINYFGAESLNSMRSLCMKLSTYHQKERFDLQGVAIVRIGQITHLAFLDELKQYQDRSMVEIEIRYTAEIESLVGLIEQVEIQDEDGILPEKRLKIRPHFNQYRRRK